MNKMWIKCLLAVAVTISVAIYQRMTGPTYPVSGKVRLGESIVTYSLPRNYEVQKLEAIHLDLPDETKEAHLVFRRYKYDSEWSKVSLQKGIDEYSGHLPQQPPAGKLEYFILVQIANQSFSIPQDRTVIIRFKGAVPSLFLFPHILFMYAALLFSSITFFEAIAGGKSIMVLTVISTLTLFLGGIILGPIVQKYAFGALWTGLPFGYDLTDNKTLFAMLGWLIALFQVRRGGVSSRWWVIGAALLLFCIYLIPHSMFGSKLDYNTMQVVTGN